jgi:hypothetical protein
MGEVQSFREEHAEEVARIYLRAGRGKDRAPGKNLTEYISQLHLANPWATPEIPSLVYLEKGKVVGALGVLPGAMEFKGQPIRMAIMTVYMVDTDYRNGPAGLQLMQRAMKGPQDFFWADGASGYVPRIWTALGGHTASLYAFNWIRILRPLGTARLGLDHIGAPGRLLKPLSGLLTVPGDWLLSKAPQAALKEPASPYHSNLVTADDLLKCINELGWREPLKPSYSPASFSWLMREAARSKWGPLRMKTVTNPDGVLSGWFIYYAASGGASFVLQIGVRRKEDFTNTMLALFRDAWEQGSVCIKGASMPAYLTEMTELYCIFRHPSSRALVHSRNADIADALRRGEAAITRIEGGSWMRFSRETWDE